MLGIEEPRRRQGSKEGQHDFMFKVPETVLGTYCVSGPEGLGMTTALSLDSKSSLSSSITCQGCLPPATELGVDGGPKAETWKVPSRVVE